MNSSNGSSCGNAEYRRYDNTAIGVWETERKREREREREKEKEWEKDKMTIAITHGDIMEDVDDDIDDTNVDIKQGIDVLQRTGHPYKEMIYI